MISIYFLAAGSGRKRCYPIESGQPSIPRSVLWFGMLWALLAIVASTFRALASTLISDSIFHLRRKRSPHRQVLASAFRADDRPNTFPRASQGSEKRAALLQLFTSSLRAMESDEKSLARTRLWSQKIFSS